MGWEVIGDFDLPAPGGGGGAKIYYWATYADFVESEIAADQSSLVVGDLLIVEDATYVWTGTFTPLPIPPSSFPALEGESTISRRDFTIPILPDLSFNISDSTSMEWWQPNDGTQEAAQSFLLQDDKTHFAANVEFTLTLDNAELDNPMWLDVTNSISGLNIVPLQCYGKHGNAPNRTVWMGRLFTNIFAGIVYPMQLKTMNTPVTPVDVIDGGLVINGIGVQTAVYPL